MPYPGADGAAQTLTLDPQHEFYFYAILENGAAVTDKGERKGSATYVRDMFLAFARTNFGWTVPGGHIGWHGRDDGAGMRRAMRARTKNDLLERRERLKIELKEAKALQSGTWKPKDANKKLSYTAN